MKSYLQVYLRNRPLFLSLIRSKEAGLFAQYLPLKSPVLDVGCGDGFFARVAFGHLDVGLDVADSRISQAAAGSAYQKVVTYNGRRFPFPARSFNTVVSNCVLEHLPNLQEVVHEIFQVLRPGGLFITTVMAAPWENYLWLKFPFYRSWMRNKQRHFNLLKSGEWEKLFKKSGFKTIRETGYLSPRACTLIDIAHYLSLPSLVSYKLRGSWDWGWHWYPGNRLAAILSENVNPQNSGAVFFVLKKVA